jgi:endoribonuclease Nob1
MFKSIDFSKINFIVFDNTAFVSGINLSLIASQNPHISMVITSGIYQEASVNNKSSRIIEVAEEQGLLLVNDPSNDSIKCVNDASRKSGDLAALSKNDKEIIAICIDLQKTNPKKSVILFSDDYSVQNTCSLLKINYYPYQKKGIKKRYKWEIYCPNCYYVYPPDLLGKQCEMCGGTLKRRVYKGKRGHL